MPEPVTQAVAKALIQGLSALREYPRLEAGEDRLAEELVRCSVSVSHARATIEEFDQQCPTIRDLREQADRIRERFEPAKPKQEAVWEREYGPPQPMRIDWSAMSAQQHEDAKVQMWAAIRKHLGVKDFARVSWTQVYGAKRDLGYELSAYERDWLRRAGEPFEPRAAAPAPAPITEFDVEAARQRRDWKQKAGGDNEPD
jgi:hypothetical protein